MMDRRILVAIILLLAYISGYAHRYMFKHLEVADGLSSNTVYSIYQDRDGFMWFGLFYLSGSGRIYVVRYAERVEPL